MRPAGFHPCGGASSELRKPSCSQFLAVLSARIGSVETQSDSGIAGGDPEFMAAGHRTGAQETADNEKRERLAAARVHAGSWSKSPSERVDRLAPHNSRGTTFRPIRIGLEELMLRD